MKKLNKFSSYATKTEKKEWRESSLNDRIIKLGDISIFMSMFEESGILLEKALNC